MSAGECRDREAFRDRPVRCPAQTLDCRTHDWLVEPLPAIGEGLGMPEPERACIPTLGVGARDGQKALSRQTMIPDKKNFKKLSLF